MIGTGISTVLILRRRTGRIRQFNSHVRAGGSESLERPWKLATGAVTKRSAVYCMAIGGQLLFACATAVAADMTAPVYTKAPAIESIYSWTGFYVGAHAGYLAAEANASAADTAAIVGTYGRMPKPAGGFGGLQAGYNYQLSNRWVLGIEASVDGLGIDGLRDTLGIAPGSSLTVKTDWVGGLVGRVGYAVGHWLPYFFAGGTWAHDKENGFNPFIGPFALANTHSGWSTGAGVEYAFANHWSARLQYRYVDVDRQQYNRVQVGGTASGVDVGASYHF
jgi:outer membrane immunogenic protein